MNIEDEIRARRTVNITFTPDEVVMLETALDLAIQHTPDGQWTHLAERLRHRIGEIEDFLHSSGQLG